MKRIRRGIVLGFSVIIIIIVIIIVIIILIISLVFLSCLFF